MNSFTIYVNATRLNVCTAIVQNPITENKLEFLERRKKRKRNEIHL